MRTLELGGTVYLGEQRAVLIEIIGLESAAIKIVDSGESQTVALAELSLAPPLVGSRGIPLAGVDRYEMALVLQKFKALRPLLQNEERTEEDVKLVAIAEGVSTRTIYRWIARYTKAEVMTGLIRSVRADKGSRTLSSEVESVVKDKIDNYYLTLQRPSVQALYEKIKIDCRRLSLKPPHKNTVAKRVVDIPEEIKTKKRFGYKKAAEIHVPHRGRFPGADFPNAVAQIDHTPVDIILVDREHRLPIGRPYLTLAIDVATKMVTGYYLSLDPPGSLSASLCISHAVQRKDIWLARRNIQAEWPIHGKMVKIHVDNAKEFRSNAMKYACDEHGIILEWRPKGQPNYGPHIERAFRTFMQEVHTLQGTTFSNVVKKMDYDSEGKACMTLEEFDQWFAIFLAHVYHNKPHAGISKVAPIKMYHRFVHGTSTQLGVGFPAVIDDEEKFRLDFMPFAMRTVQQSGIELNHIFYYAPVLRPFIALKKPGSNRSESYHCAYDPRDLSVIYFYDAELRMYHSIPYANASHPSISVWEYRAVLEKIKNDPDAIVDEHSIFAGAEEMQRVEAQAIEKTAHAKTRRAVSKRQLRNSERRKNWVGVHQENAVEAEVEVAQDIDDFDDDEIRPFDEIYLS